MFNITLLILVTITLAYVQEIADKPKHPLYRKGVEYRVEYQNELNTIVCKRVKLEIFSTPAVLATSLQDKSSTPGTVLSWADQWWICNDWEPL